MDGHLLDGWEWYHGMGMGSFSVWRWFFIAGVYGIVSALVLYCSIHSFDIFLCSVKCLVKM